jgi:hypothetical protein
MTGKRVPRKSRQQPSRLWLAPCSEQHAGCLIQATSRSVACCAVASLCPLPSPKPFLAESDAPCLLSTARGGGGGGLGGRGGGGFGRDGSVSASVTMRFSCFPAPPVVIGIRGEGRAADLRSPYSSGSVVNVSG